MDQYRVSGIITPYEKIYLLCLAATGCFQAFAQDDDLLKQLEKSEPQPREYISNTFKGTKLINLATNEISGKRTLRFPYFAPFW